MLTALDKMNGYQITAHNHLISFIGGKIHYETTLDDIGNSQLSIVTDSGVRLATLTIGRDGLIEHRSAGVTTEELNGVLRSHFVRVADSINPNPATHDVHV
jgi:hypothetical protein